MNLYEELRGLIVALSEGGVEYGVCGGIALALHGLPRATRDIDILIQKRDLQRALAVVALLGFDTPARPMVFKRGEPDQIEVQRVSKLGAREPLSLDLLLVAPILEPVWESRQDFDWEGVTITAVSATGLAIMKRLAGRPQDLADLHRLGMDSDDQDA
jgi:hypothetical protein